MDDLISREKAIAEAERIIGERAGFKAYAIVDILKKMDAEPQWDTLDSEVIPHRNYKYLSDFWCECGWHLGRAESVKYCPDCGKKVNWNEWIWNERLNQQTGGIGQSL